MFDDLMVFSRLALYVGLMLTFGLPVFVLHAMDGNWSNSPIARRMIRVAGAAALLSLVASGLVLWAMAAAMSGSGEPGAERAVAWTLITQTMAGETWDVRVILLVLSLGVVLSSGIGVRARATMLAMLGAAALATLAWAGHGAMSEGAAGWLHLSADIAHLLAAGAWVGALVALVFIAMIAARQRASETIGLLSSASSGFARLGTLIVAVLVVTGVINYILIVGPSLSGLIESTYGRLLFVKFGIFATMLALAASNRFRLAPALELAMRSDDTSGAVAALKRSLCTEMTLAFVVLGLVAWLGTLNPDG